MIEIVDLGKHYQLKSLFGKAGTVKALDGVSFKLEKGRALGIVGESGCGKSTLAKTLLGLEKRTFGDILIDGKSIDELKPQDRHKTIQMVFQDPYSSLNPRKKCWQLIAEPLLINTKLKTNEIREKVDSVMALVGLRPEHAERYPHMMSGGQRQRIGIARALVLDPKVLILDEPVSALDVSIQAQVLNLLIKLQDELKLTYLFISHDLSVVNHLCDQIAVMYLGKVVEMGPRKQIFEEAVHPYTKALLTSCPSLDPKTQHTPLKGELPSPLNPPEGCAFHKRCPIAVDQCHKTRPELKKVHGRFTACHEVH
ncbi:MAG: oligopeptide ABC transporter ATP-binding protein OppF [Bdellovibrio sp. CG12_big_fil_rev_8_21_14_0_65_39_13]|nr:MAG: oligopeptide ABC transporter ATP-binding protein OppF [Bdellovibrio sp. CG22_combo_CG10-13_8_21_14_all_39_27]PIQ61754.1 MAG: oligopeptide ABC transporter ATP-binding protein OppF [Bdellovibrio sp. CG12_big_fil_rev_8_21_14_0_65_39_13]PIR34902.1 MAG: oligopeptide ABC transporter ATP-binding protein OppF [Bdellovibrio sp. CG11_big_fil_rev_8_21_14_0_20_39_38]PJB53549.1 MAG: oligopeptide ABC transporter ATP-binding protein OppF [Bdellovibrio sp. CG_4_9_14_3_um_filter_39_7]